MLTKLILAGFGGQGVLSMGQILAYGAMAENKEATFLPSYGPEMRGGTANCHVVISDKPVASPLIATCDVLVAMNRPSLEKFESKVKPGGVILINSGVCDVHVTRTDVTVFEVNVLEAAIELGNAKCANTVMLGKIIKEVPVLTDENVLSALDYFFKAKPKVLDLNHRAFALGKQL